MDAQWSEAYAALTAADADHTLDADGLEQLAVAAYMTGHDDDCCEALTRAYRRRAADVDADAAVRCAFWIGLNLLLRGQLAPATGWFGRGEQLAGERSEESVGSGYLSVATALQALIGGNPPRALDESDRAARIGRRAGDVDLATLGNLGCGQALVALGRRAEGVAALDEAMVSITAGEASPVVTGIVYCAVIEACHELFDVRRAQEWTDALGEWCDRQSGLVPYRGQCMVHRSELLRTHGSWGAALAEAEQAAEWLSDPPHPALGAALYQQAELHRLRGEVDAAERHYRRASESGHGVQPGFALLRLAQGRVDDAAAAVHRALVEPQLPSIRTWLLAAQAEIAIAADDVAAARVAADELAGLCGTLGSPRLLDAVSADVEGAVRLAEDDAPAALQALRRAWTIWHELDAPYDAARTRVQIALACRRLGDEESALLELDAARRTFAELGAQVDGARVERLLARQPTGTLTSRELEVLALVATGATNRAIASELVISEKTVARHVSNIFTKLGVASRAAATAHAYEHGLVGGPRRG